MPEGADTLAVNAIAKEKRVAGGALNTAGLGPTATAGSSQANSREVKKAQAELQREGFYRGPIDGIVGPETRQALAAYQAREGLQQTARLDRETMERMNLAAASPRTAQSPGMEMSGSSTPMPPSDQGAADANSAANPSGTPTSTDTCGNNSGASNTSC